MTDRHMKIDEEIVREFRAHLESYAKEHGLLITSIKGWTEPKIRWMALNDRTCCCDKTRKCPCETGLVEVRTEKDHMCKCSVFKKG